MACASMIDIVPQGIPIRGLPEERTCIGNESGLRVLVYLEVPASSDPGFANVSPTGQYVKRRLHGLRDKRDLRCCDS